MNTPIVKIEKGHFRFPRWPKVDAWLQVPKNEQALIAALAALCVGVWIWGASL